MKKLGVVVPVYNVEECLSKCVDSIINQTFRDIDIVLVDDGSTDASGKICDSYAEKDERIRVIHQKNAGPLSARYIGVKTLNTEYVTFVDADDWIDINTYLNCCKYMDECVDVIMFGIRRVYETYSQFSNATLVAPGRYERKEIEELFHPIMIWDVETHKCGVDAAMWNKLSKRELCLKYLGQAQELNIHYGEDVAVVYPLLLQTSSLVVLNETYYFHHQRKNGELAQYLKDNNYINNMCKLYDYLVRVMPDNEVIRKQLDYFALHAMEMRLRIYGDYITRRDFVFPFDVIPIGCNIVLYGAGGVGQTYYKQIKRINYCNVIMWVDKNYSKYKEKGVRSVEELLDMSGYDYIVIANQKTDTCKEIKEYLIGIGVAREKIIFMNHD